MTSFATSGGKFIIRNGKLAIGRPCCCKNCCESAFGKWPTYQTNYPPQLVVALSNGCCTNLAREFTLHRNDSFTSGPQWQNFVTFGFCNEVIDNTDVRLSCFYPQWRFGANAGGNASIDLAPITVTAFTCKPFYLEGDVTLEDRQPPYTCQGHMHIVVTE